MLAPGLLGEVRERSDLRDGCFDLHWQVSDRELLARLLFDSGAVWVSFPASSAR